MEKIKIEDLKKEMTEQEAAELAVSVVCSAFICSDAENRGGNYSALLKAKRNNDREKLEALAFNWFGFPYISQSVNGKAAAIWNTNTAASLGNFPSVAFRGAALTNDGQAVGIFQEHNENGEEVGAVLLLLIEELPTYVSKKITEEHEKNRIKQLESVNEFRKKAAELLPKACQILENHRGKRWGKLTRDKIREELREITPAVLCCWVSVEYKTIYLTIKKQYGLTSLLFYWSFDDEKNTPAEEIKPTARDWEKVQAVEVKPHRQKIKKLIKEMETKAAELKKTIEEYRTATADLDDVYKYRAKASTISPNICDFTSYYLDN